MSTNPEWCRPESEWEARDMMLAAEARRDYETAALAALAAADYCGARTVEGGTSFERQALVYASLNQASTAVWIAENRQAARGVG